MLRGTVKQHLNNRPLRFNVRECLRKLERPLTPLTTKPSDHPATTNSHTLHRAHARGEGKRRRRLRDAFSRIGDLEMHGTMQRIQLPTRHARAPNYKIQRS